MCAQVKNSEVNFTRFSVLLQLVAVSIFLSSSPSFADESAGIATGKPDPVNWVSGPTVAALRDFAEINVPEGYRFATEDQARNVFKMNGQPAPPELAGILTPASGKWLIVFKYTELGYVNEHDPVDATGIMTSMRAKVQRQNETMARPGANMITMLDWETEPTYNRGDHGLEWAIRAQTPTGASVNHVYCLLGRNGVLSGILVQPRQLLVDTVPLKQLMSGITFKAGYAYTDYRRGDLISPRALASLITDDQPEEAPAKRRVPLLLISALIAGALLLTGAGIVVGLWLKKRRQARLMEWRKEAALATAHSNGTTHVVVNGSLPLAVNHSNGNGNGHAKVRRRRMFNYQKYYSDLLMQVSDRAYETNFAKVRRNGSSHGTDAVPASSNGAVERMAPPATPVGGNLNLIESQRNLIEEQQRLIREQTKLIEEKTRLIHEKNQVLEKQAELFGNNSF